MESSSDITYSGGHEVYIKEEPWCPDEVPIAVKCEESPVSNNGLQTEILPVSSDDVRESKNSKAIDSDHEMHFKVEIKEEPHWLETSSVEISCKSENPFHSDIDLQNEIKQTDSPSDKIAKDVTAEVPRMYTESMCVNDNSIFRATLEKQDCLIVRNSENNCERIRTNETVERHHYSKGLYKCEVCDKSFKWFSNLKSHRLFHEGKRSHVCKICGKGFVCLSVLNQHKFVHETKRSHKCNVCGKGFVRLTSLNLHTLIHEKTKPHSCEICGMSFTWGSSLKIHKLNHEGKRPHACEICKQNFTRRSSLKRHKLIHEGNKAHKCEICEKSFIQASVLKRHKLIHMHKRLEACEILRKALLKPLKRVESNS